MPLTSDILSTHSRQEFCLALKAARERSGVTLQQIADATKIPASLFAALERSDLRRWPDGLFRRSFFRDYARMIGVPVAEACAEFVRLFEDEGANPVATPATVASEAAEVRLVLDEEWHGPRPSVRSRLLAALVDFGLVIIVAGALSWLAGMQWPAAIAVVALSYFSLATALFGESPARWAISRRQSVPEMLMQGPAFMATAWQQGADAISRVFGNAGRDGSPAVEEPEIDVWVTDARRVGPEPRLRVRLKVPH